MEVGDFLYFPLLFFWQILGIFDIVVVSEFPSSTLRNPKRNTSVKDRNPRHPKR